MTLFELQAWLGHRSPQSTQYYAKITPNTLSKAYSEVGNFERNVRTIEVLVDRDAVTTGAAATGEPWQHYDLGHGYCTYTFFEQCQHRMACARCDLYTPKGSTRAQLLEAKSNLVKMPVSIPLAEDEQAAVTDGQSALDHLLERLADTPPQPDRHPDSSTSRRTPLSCPSSPYGKAAQAQRHADIGVRTGLGECHSHCRDLDGRTRRLLPHWPDRAPELRNGSG
ncbi:MULTISPECIES: hypothetical protein [unclassified Streptomyces]|uniref:hypothetical protein n=1 Tax=unclassified Streptomyces TaxID=2593676 RepID=UPI0020244F59|nr:MULTISPECIES: hypothetical protein [unclassified Streptomyces]WSC24438.1 hypothetical protein OIE60_34885 [Streptomyces sp. NBC_01766]